MIIRRIKNKVCILLENEGRTDLSYPIISVERTSINKGIPVELFENLALRIIRVIGSCEQADFAIDYYLCDFYADNLRSIDLGSHYRWVTLADAQERFLSRKCETKILYDAEKYWSNS